MILCFEADPDHRVVYLNSEHIVGFYGNALITSNPVYNIQVSSKDYDRIFYEWRESVEKKHLNYEKNS